ACTHVNTLSLHDALPIYMRDRQAAWKKWSGRPRVDRKHEALPGHGSKQSPVPIPKKSEQPSQDIRDLNKPPVSLNPADAKKPMRSEEHTSELQSRFDLVC